MQSGRGQGVQHGEHAVVGPRVVLSDWDAARILLKVVRRGSFRAAARDLDQSTNMLRARIAELEQTLKFKLLVRHVGGVRLTPEGQGVFAAAERMEEASFDLLRARASADEDIAGEIRLAVTEGVGTFWLVPRLVEFQRRHPKLLIHLDCAVQSRDVMRLEADISIQLARPQSPELVVTKLGRLHLIPFAAPSYLKTHGRPQSIADLLNHRIVIQADNVTELRQLYDRVFPGVPPEGLVAMRTNVGSAYYWALAKGGGIGLMPTYAIALGGDVVPVDLGIHDHVDIWLSYHPDMKAIPRVRQTVDWVIELFSPRLYPWFRDEFVHPDEFGKVYRGEPLVHMLAGFSSSRVNGG